jgi:16S rRNA (guanine527-N7)-methyltransferase
MPEADARAARAELERLLSDAGLTLPPAVLDQLQRYVRLLLEANERLNLTRVVEPAAVARLHLLDALSSLPIIDAAAPARALDLGSGGGVPGLVLAIARPEVRWTLLDSVRKKADALRTFATSLELANVEVVADRAELLGRGPARGSFDVVTARACAALPALVELALPLLRDGGTLLAWKGPIGHEELAAGGRASALIGGSAPAVRAAGIQGLGDHRFVLITKLEPTPERYPRRPGQPVRRPLG